MTDYLTVAEVLSKHTDQIQRYGGSDSIRDPGLLEAALYPVFGILAGREDLDEPLAGKSTLNRMELGAGTKDRYKKITFWKEAIR